MSEAQALNDWFSGEEINDPKSIHFDIDTCDAALEHANNVPAYNAAKSAQVGSTIICPICGKQFKKKSYQQAFCSNKGRGNCKDRFHNTSPKRLDRSISVSST